MTDRPIPDVVALATLIGGALFSAAVAEVVGPYMVILMMSAIGASFSVKRREKSGRVSALLFFLRICCFAVGATVGISVLLAGWHPSLSERALLAPVAFVLGLIGDDWPAIGNWAGGKLNNLADAYIRSRDKGGNP